MKLTENNILFVKRHEKDGVTYSWYIAMKSRRISDNKNFVNYENGKTVIKEFSQDRLPKAVQNFIAKHEETLLVDGDYKIYIMG